MPCTNKPSGRRMHISHKARWDDARPELAVPTAPAGFIL